ncbi:hypothetical protein ACHAXT_008517 [Thalassiosira profunda]
MALTEPLLAMSALDPQSDAGDELGREALAAEATEALAASPQPTFTLASFWRSYGRTTLTILFWYAVSNTTILTTKWLFTNHFPFPLTVTSVSNGVAAVWAALVTFCCCRAQHEREGPLARHTITHYVLPIGLCTGMEIASSNIALKLLSVSFGTILKGGGPIWTFLWGLVFGVEKFGARLVACLLMMALGIALASLGEGGEFQLAGFTLQLFSSCLGGFRWAMTHKLLLNDDDEDEASGHRHRKMSPLRAILYTSPTTALFCIPLALGFEASAVESDAKVDSAHEVALVILTMLFVATLVFILLLSEYWLVNATSSLALSVAGVFKELLTIGGGLFFFSEHLDLLNVIGFILCQVGILMYVKLRYDSKSGDEDEQSTNEPYMTVDSSAHDTGFEQDQDFSQESSLSEVSNQSTVSEQMELT